MSFLTAVIATRNDPLLNQTILSMGGQCPIIIIDDASDEPILMGGMPNITIHRNVHRLGPGPSRHRGGCQVDDGWIMFCDSHMKFPRGWYQQVETYLLASREEEVWGPVYHSNIIQDSFWYDNHYIAGADFYFWRHNAETGKFSFMDLLPRRIQHAWSYSVPCLLGGCYFVHTSWFKQMDGYKALIGYGCEEQWLSLSTWLMGGSVNIMGKLAVTHILQTATSGKRPMIPEWESNRIAILKRVLGPTQYQQFLSWLPIAQTTKSEVDTRCSWVNQDKDKLTILEVCRTFGLQSFEDAIEIMASHREKMEQQ